MQTILPGQRALFDIPDEVAYLNAAYIGPIPKAVSAAGEAGMRRKMQPWLIQPADLFTKAEGARSLFAQLAHADADEVALVPSVSSGMAVAAQVLPLEAGQTILTLAEPFPSNLYPWMELARTTGARFVTIPRPADDDWTARLLERIDNRTGVVALPPCHWTDGGLLDLVARLEWLCASMPPSRWG